MSSCIVSFDVNRDFLDLGERYARSKPQSLRQCSPRGTVFFDGAIFHKKAITCIAINLRASQTEVDAPTCRPTTPPGFTLNNTKHISF
jgi:hypothetical protein